MNLIEFLLKNNPYLEKFILENIENLLVLLHLINYEQLNTLARENPALFKIFVWNSEKILQLAKSNPKIIEELTRLSTENPHKFNQILLGMNGTERYDLTSHRGQVEKEKIINSIKQANIL